MHIAKNLAPPFTEQTSHEKSKCPLCKRIIANACVLETSGYCYCYKCVAEYVKER